MNVNPCKPAIVILGAGPAGLGAAYRLARRQSFHVTVIERNPRVGGNAGSFDVEGIRVDYGSHRLHPSCDPLVLSDIRELLGGDLLVRPRHGRILLQGRWIHFPLRPLDLIRRLPPSFILGVAADAFKRYVRRRGGRADETFESVMRQGVGGTISDEFYFPYVRKIWGAEPRELSPTQARRRVSAGSLGAMVKKVASGLRRSQGIQGGFFYYPRLGFGQIASAYAEAAERCGATILRGASVTGVERWGERWAVDYSVGEGSGRVEADHVWSTIPLTALARSMAKDTPSEVLDAAGSISFRAMILVYLILSKSRFSEYDAHYFPGPEVGFSRVSEPKNYHGNPEPEGRTVLCGELPCSPNDSIWRQSDDALGRALVASLGAAGLSVGEGLRGVVTRRLRFAYPIYLSGYERHFERLEQWFDGMQNLITFGRQGLFAHDNTHHALFMAYCADQCLDDAGNFDTAQWRRHLEDFKSHVVED